MAEFAVVMIAMVLVLVGVPLLPYEFQGGLNPAVALKLALLIALVK
jgi:hypothetical protein